MNRAGVQATKPCFIEHAENLPSPPAVALEILRLTADEDVQIDSLADVISRDPALSLKMLKLANSPLFSRGGEVRSLEKATLLLGIKTVKLMSLSFSLTSELPKAASGGGASFEYGAYWDASLATAVAGRSLARLVRSRLADEGFLCGLLGRLGQLVMAEAIPIEYQVVLDHATCALPPADLERTFLGFDHHVVGADILESWGLPRIISQTIRGLGLDESLLGDSDPQVAELVAIMTMAQYASTVLCDSRKGPALQALQQLAEERFGVSSSEVDAFIVGLESGVRETAALLNIELSSLDSPRSVLDQARMQMVHISLDTALDLHQSQNKALELAAENQKLTTLANTDKLTGLHNRAFFDQTLRRVVQARLAGQGDHSLGLVILDIDHFKRFNDTYGHVVGDQVLELVASTLKGVVRATDFPVRYGGEEFVVIVPETTLESLDQVAERIRAAIETATLEVDHHTLSVTVSVGGACCSKIRRPGDGEALLELADRSLYEAKGAGRNRASCRQLESLDVG